MGNSELLYALLGGYTLAISYDSSEKIEYVGKAQPGTPKDNSEWKICKIIYDANDNIIDLQWADGEALFTKKWDDRTLYKYK